MTSVLVDTTLDHITVITLNRPDKRNAINGEITAGLDSALNAYEDDPDQRCAILTGGPTVFSAGADLAQGPGEPTPRGGIAGLIHRERTKPLIAAVEGHAVGGGFELVLCCDLVVASTTATFGFPEPKRGLMPDFGGAFRAPRVLPANIARELLLTADSLDAHRAERLGLVNRVTEPGAALAAATELAHRILANAPLAVQAAMRTANAALDLHDPELWKLSDAEHDRLLRSQDLIEGVAAFFERRPPTWTGR